MGGCSLVLHSTSALDLRTLLKYWYGRRNNLFFSFLQARKLTPPTLPFSPPKGPNSVLGL